MKKLGKKVMCFILIVNILTMSGCGGRQAYPIQVNQFNDSNMSCNQLKSELSTLKYAIRNKTHYFLT